MDWLVGLRLAYLNDNFVKQWFDLEYCMKIRDLARNTASLDHSRLQKEPGGYPLQSIRAPNGEEWIEFGCLIMVLL